MLKRKKKEMKAESLFVWIKKGRERVKMGKKWADLLYANVGRPQHHFVLLERLLHVDEALIATSSEQ
mgnify:FL=1